MFDNVDGFKVAVIGAVTVETPTLVSPAGVAGLEFTDPVDAVNDTVEFLKALDEADQPDLIVAEYHEGLSATQPTLEEGVASSAVFKKIVEQTSADVDVIFNGHTHQAYMYEAPIPGDSEKTRPVLQTGQYGTNVGQVVLNVTDEGVVDSYTMALLNVANETKDMSLRAILESSDLMKDVYGIVLRTEQNADKVGSASTGVLTAPITRAYTAGTWENGFFALTEDSKEDRGQASAMGTLVGNSLVESLSALPEAPDFGVLNPGGLRTDLYPDENGTITVAQARAVLPFNNELAIVTMTGEQIKTMLEQQWQRDAEGKVPSRPFLQLGFSDNVQYTYTEIADPEIEGATLGVVDTIWINGELVTPESEWKAGTFSFLAAGGDNFWVFQEAVVAETGLLDWSAFLGYLENESPISPDFARAGINLEGVYQGQKLKAGSEVTVTASNLNVPSVGAPAVTEIAVDLLDLTTRKATTAPVTDGAGTVTFTVPDVKDTSAALFSIDASPTGTTGLVPVELVAAGTGGGGEGTEGGATEGGATGGGTGSGSGGGKLPATGASAIALLLLVGGASVATGVGVRRKVHA